MRARAAAGATFRTSGCFPGAGARVGKGAAHESTQHALEGLILLVLNVFGDERGFFCETPPAPS